MSCCGSKRAALKFNTTLPSPSGAATPDTTTTPGVPPASADTAPVQWLRYLGAATLAVRGAASGQMYAFSPQQMSAVHADDAAAFINTGLFEAQLV